MRRARYTGGVRMRKQIIIEYDEIKGVFCPSKDWFDMLIFNGVQDNKTGFIEAHHLMMKINLEVTEVTK